jgi:glycosyltransferase involved in cell wall biosynthesis
MTVEPINSCARPVPGSVTRISVHGADVPASSRPVILIFVAHYLPAFTAGGPVRSIANLVNSLGDEYDFRIVTSDRDLGDLQPFPSVAADVWTRVGKADVLYARVGPGWMLRCRRIIGDVRPDLLYINSFFGRSFSMAILMAWWCTRKRTRCPLLLAPRGEFSQAALSLKRRRKTAYIQLVKLLGSHSKALWHASSPAEATDILGALSHHDGVAVAGPISSAAPAVATALDVPPNWRGETREFPPKPAGSLRIIFLARLVPMKNLADALVAVRSLAGNIRFTICGPREDEACWEQCRRLVGGMPSNITVELAGAVPHEQVRQTLLAHDVFLLPTLGENFGHGIAEALQAGCPVVISDRTPWRHLEELGVGWDLRLGDLAAFTRVLQQCADMAPDEFDHFRKRASAYGLAVGSDPRILNQNRQMLHAALKKGPVAAKDNVQRTDRLQLFSGESR